MKRIPVCLAVFLFIFTIVGCRSGIPKHSSKLIEDQFSVVRVFTNGVEGVAIVEKRSNNPVWIKWAFDREGLPNEVSYFFEGKNMMNVYVMTNGITRRDVAFYDTNGVMRVLWADRNGSGMFTDRVFYDKDGAPRMEVWVGQAWHNVEEIDGKRGVVEDGQWFKIKFADGVWSKVNSTREP